jgi:AraC-like DNA-binding protein
MTTPRRNSGPSSSMTSAGQRSALSSALPHDFSEELVQCLPASPQTRRLTLPETRLSLPVRRMRDAIHLALLDTDLSVKHMKQVCQIFDNNISSRFRLELGITIKAYIEELRLEAARIIIENTSLPFADVALCVGYDHIQTFYRAFRRKFGCTPGHYRSLSSDRADAVRTSAAQRPEICLQSDVFPDTAEDQGTLGCPRSAP